MSLVLEINNKAFLNAEQLAEKLSVSIHTIRKWRKYQLIPYKKFGRSIRFSYDEVLSALEARDNR